MQSFVIIVFVSSTIIAKFLSLLLLSFLQKQYNLFVNVKWVSECVGFNVPLDTKHAISRTSLSSQSLGCDTDKTNLQHPR